MSLRDSKDKLAQMLRAGTLEPFIRHIRFPSYKNLTKDTRIEFEFPITALVGPNGTNKSSILRAIESCPGQVSLGNYWFATSMDPIEVADRPCYIYGYCHASARKVVEVLKTRIKSGDDPDYWEPSRAVLTYGMEAFPRGGVAGNTNKTRWDALPKPTVYVDFRQSLSAFDKHFYQDEDRSPSSLADRKKFLRRRAPYLKSAIEGGHQRYEFYRRERIVGQVNRTFTSEELEALSLILGRQYFEVHWIRHYFYNVDAYTCLLKTDALTYSEAFAGSGEFAVARLVVDILGAPQHSLVLLDEPEVSLHPGAQEKLIEFIARQAVLKKLQIVISTHSPAIIRYLPPEAIKTLIVDPATGLVKLPNQRTAPDEAFFYLGEPIHGVITVVVEDALAEKIVKKALRLGGEAFARRFEVKSFPGGAATLWTQYLPSFSAEGRSDVFILLDGDQLPETPLLDPDEITDSHIARLRQSLLDVAGAEISFSVDGGSGGGNEAQKIASLRTFVQWARSNVDYLPGGRGPEEFVWQNMEQDDLSNGVSPELDPKDKFVQLTMRELGRANYEAVNSGDILQTQERRLTGIDDNHAAIRELKDKLESFANR